MPRKALKTKLYERMMAQTPIIAAPLTEIMDDRRVLIENHRGIIAYGNDEIRISVRNGYNCVVGSGLEVLCISGDKVVISGQIECVRFCRGKEQVHAQE